MIALTSVGHRSASTLRSHDVPPRPQASTGSSRMRRAANPSRDKRAGARTERAQSRRASSRVCWNTRLPRAASRGDEAANGPEIDGHRRCQGTPLREAAHASRAKDSLMRQGSNATTIALLRWQQWCNECGNVAAMLPRLPH
ncbi:unnamed protein product [Prorocentrum cordatum]|uniref:Uncharacterized protein n=1 Tax=Prorocentrum cordatum TaxID=2364126 RepID=A0ABN9Y1K5_9DINO|nr:unnamed protein product [Polarella glacialis]